MKNYIKSEKILQVYTDGDWSVEVEIESVNPDSECRGAYFNIKHKDSLEKMNCGYISPLKENFEQCLDLHISRLFNREYIRGEVNYIYDYMRYVFNRKH